MSVTLSRVMSEDQLLSAIVEAATYRKWQVFHIRRSDKAQQQGHAGFPDLVLARKGRVLFIETKAERGKLTPGQVQWSQALFPHWQVIRPADLDWLLERLR